jgi:GDPmannose 4,6-dehydratase
MAQKTVFKLVKKFRKYGMDCYSLVFLSVESPLRKNNFFVKKVCLHAKKSKKISLGNIDTFRDYSYASEIAKSVYFTSKLKAMDIILSSGVGIYGKEILDTAYKQNSWDYRNFYKINDKFLRISDPKFFIDAKKTIIF